MNISPSFYALGPTNSASVLTGYRSRTTRGEATIIIASLHVDFADEGDDSALTKELTYVLDKAASLEGDRDRTLNGVLESIHVAALESRRYFSAAVLHIKEDSTEVVRCGLAGVLISDGDPRTVLTPELRSFGDMNLLTNSAGAPNFRLPADIAILEAHECTVVVVGGNMSAEQIPRLKDLSLANSAPQSRGGIALLTTR